MYENEYEDLDEPVKILAGVDARWKPFHWSHLKWRPKGKNDPVPEEICETRLSLLSGEDAAALESEFANGKAGREFKALFFGGNLYGDDTKNAAVTMLRCAFLSGDAEGALRLFKASAAYDGDRDNEGLILGGDGHGGYIVCRPGEKYAPLAEEAVKTANRYREKVPEEKDLTRRMKEKGSKEIARGDKER